MANPNPWKARQVKAEKRIKGLTEGDIRSARKILWEVLLEGSERIRALPPDAHNDYYKLTNAITGAVREYRSLVETTEIEERLSALERRQQWTGAAA